MTRHNPPAADVNGQLISALVTITGLSLIAGGLIYAGIISGKWDVLGVPIGTVVGALGNSLSAPSGIGNVLRANAAAPAAATEVK